jgi:hypothetical protein
MTSILTVTQNDEGQYQVIDAGGKVMEGPFETNAAAWRALDRLDSESFGGMEKVRKSKLESRRGKTKKKPKSKKLLAKEERRMKINAAKAPGWIRGMAMGKFDPAGKRKYRDQKLGTFGAASEVRRIDPAEYLAEKTAKGQ